MDVLDLARYMIYRMHEKGLEIFLIKPELEDDPEVWKLPQGLRQSKENNGKREFIQLEDTQDEHGQGHHFMACEGDWHDIPSIRGIIKHDLKRAKRKIEKNLPNLDNGIYLSAKEAVHKLLPHERSAITELEEILQDRNMLRNI